ncbi:16S rRNA (guanine(966)-N(2))-methyltransferase RsmD [Corallincola platygyrae]|uniref:Ribosomal RNA small subunit methyltransferase D n=1 Tax=Corallincola platygyrae TaxID=1193278 RepID=A0ABW4XPH2_9GAMM
MAKRPNRGSSGQIRIIGGQWRGRKLPVLDSEGLRPTTDRVKETLFNWLMHDVRGARCLDLFAGSGGLGFECLSRFADSVLFLEKDSKAAQQIKTNLSTLSADTGEVKCADALQLLKQPPTQPYDLVFIDPPFRKGLLEQVLQGLAAPGWLKAGSQIYIESEKELPLPPLPPNWHLHREKTAGQVVYRLFEIEA